MLAIVCRDLPAVADRSDISPPERVPAPASGAGSLQRPRRVLVWSLIVLASVLLIVSMTANWVQLAALDTGQVQNTTDEILADEDVQQALSIYLVDQLYANVDVRAEIEEQLPGSFRALSAPIAAATRQLALNVSERALATPRVQALVSDAVGRAHERFVNLIRSKGEYVATTGGEVTLDYGEPGRRPGRSPGGGPGDGLRDPARRAGTLGGPQAKLDHGSGADQVGARGTRSGAGGLAELPA